MSDSGPRVSRMLALAALAALPIVSGCVAALPVVAASAIAGKKIAGKRQGGVRSAPRVALPAEPPATAGIAATVDEAPQIAQALPGTVTRTQEYADGSRVEVTMPARTRAAVAAAPSAAFAAPPSGDPAPQPVPAPAPHVANAASVPSPARIAPGVIEAPPPGTQLRTSDGFVATVVAGDLPPPSGSPAGAAPLAPPDYGAFTRYAETQGNLPIAGGDRRSAMLTDPGTLNPATRLCSVQPAAVLVDLDPAGESLDPVHATHADPALAAALAGLRAQDIVIAWTSSVTADKAGAVRKALVSSGLDPAGKDELVLLRFPEERKQTRRTDIAKELCVVAIAGDDRTDFDELFEYLKKPTRPTSLEALVGNGWFLIPQPLTPN